MNQTIITNFNAPKDLRTRFDETCRLSGKTRTSILIDLMENYVLSQSRTLADLDKTLAEIDETLARVRDLRRRQSHKENSHLGKTAPGAEPDNEDEPLDFFHSDGREEW